MLCKTRFLITCNAQNKHTRSSGARGGRGVLGAASEVSHRRREGERVCWLCDQVKASFGSSSASAIAREPLGHSSMLRKPSLVARERELVFCGRLRSTVWPGARSSSGS